MPRIIDADYSQTYLLPPCLEDWIGREHPARVVREVVAQMDLELEGFAHPLEGSVGRPAYAPALLLRLWLYGYLSGVRSSRKLEQAARDTMGFIWLCGQQAPDHNSLWRFWKAHYEPLRSVFKRTVLTAKGLGLLGLELQAIDGTKLAAASSGEGGWDEAALERALARLEAEVRAAGETEEVRELALSGEQKAARAQLAKTGITREAVAAALNQLREQPPGQERHFCHPLEPEAQRMKSRSGGNPFSFNAQAAVDSQEQIIVAADVTNAVNDDHQALPLMEQAEAHTGARPVSVADTGYFCAEAQRLIEQSPHTLLTPLPANVANPQDKTYHTSKFHFNPESNTVTCPQGRALPHSSTRLKDGVLKSFYRSYRVCQGCPVLAECTADKRGRTIDIAPGHAAVEAQRRRMQDPVHQHLLKQRGRLVEPVFGWIKANDGFKRFTARGLAHARAQWFMVCAARNLRTIHRAWVKNGCRLASGEPATA